MKFSRTPYSLYTAESRAADVAGSDSVEEVVVTSRTIGGAATADQGQSLVMSGGSAGEHDLDSEPSVDALVSSMVAGNLASSERRDYTGSYSNVVEYTLM